MLSEALHAPLVPEASRAYLNQKLSADSQFQYSEPDLLEIASEQNSLEQMALNKDPQLLLCDTDLLVIIIWSEVRFGHCHQWLLDTFADSLSSNPRYYLLCNHDVPWHPDPLRESADSRAELFALYQQKLEYYNLPYSIMSGDVESRQLSALEILGKKVARH